MEVQKELLWKIRTGIHLWLDMVPLRYLSRIVTGRESRAPVAPVICHLCQLSFHVRAFHLLPPGRFHDLCELVQQRLAPDVPGVVQRFERFWVVARRGSHHIARQCKAFVILLYGLLIWYNFMIFYVLYCFVITCNHIITKVQLGLGHPDTSGLQKLLSHLSLDMGGLWPTWPAALQCRAFDTKFRSSSKEFFLWLFLAASVPKLVRRDIWEML